MAKGDFGQLDALPDDRRDIFMWLCQDVVALHRKWEFYLSLFGKSENYPIITILPTVFSLIEESLRTDMTMAVCRLSDRNKTCGQENLNFRSLEDFYVQDAKLKQIVDAFVANCDVVRTHRNKLVGHSDKLARLTPQQVMIPQIKKSDMDAILKSAGEIINHVARQCVDV
jgi:AbiU2